MQGNSNEWQVDYRALADGGASVVLRDWTQVTLTGNDRAQFLHNMGTNDIRNLAKGQCCEAFCTDVKGKVVAHGLVFSEQESLSLLTVPGQGHDLIQHLDYYLIREDVQLSDDSDHFTWSIVSGKQAGSALDQLVGECELPGEPGRFITVGTGDILLAKLPVLWTPHWLLRFRNDQRERAVGQLQSLQEVGEQSPAWQALRIESQWPQFGVDFDRSALPQEVNRDAQAIHLNKGCYLGQETVARIDALGHVNKKLVLVRFADDEVPPAGAVLLKDGNEAGHVTSACWSQHFSAPAAIAWVKRGANEIGAALEGPAGSAMVMEPVPSIG